MHNLSMDANHVCQTHLGHLEFMVLLRLNVFVGIVEQKISLIFLHKNIDIPFQVKRHKAIQIVHFTYQERMFTPVLH